MGIVKRQSLWNAAGGYLGVVIGAVNALFLMPWAFAQDPDGFGFVRWILSASLLVGAFAHVGFPHALVTFAPRLPADRRRDVFGAGLVSGFGVVLALGVLGIFWGDAWIQQAVGSGSFSWGWQPLWALVASYVVFELVASQAQSAYRVVAPQWIKDVGRKAVLTLASAALILDLLDFPSFLWAVTAGHALLTLVLVFYARKWIAVGWDWSGLPWRAFLAYAGFMVLTAGAQMAMGQLDVLLIGKRLNLAAVAQYSIAFQLGVVVSVPSKAMGYSLRPLIAEAWSRSDTARLLELVRRGGVHQFYGTAFLVLGLWAVLPVVELALPVSYRGVSDLAMAVALAQLIHVATGVSGLVLLASPKYKWDFWANVLLIGVLVVISWWALPRYGTVAMGWALVASALLYNAFKATLVKSLLGDWPSGVRPLKLLLFVLLAVAIHAAAGSLRVQVGLWTTALLEALAQSVFFVFWVLRSNEVPDFKLLLEGVWARVGRSKKRQP
jgi:O-antigen/teichoic acid export membrane protein